VHLLLLRLLLHLSLLLLQQFLLLLLLLLLLLVVVLRLQLLLLMVLLLGRQSHITWRHRRQLVVGRHRRLLLLHEALLPGGQHGCGANGSALRALVLVGLLGGRVDAIDAAHEAAGQEGGGLMGQPLVFVQIDGIAKLLITIEAGMAGLVVLWWSLCLRMLCLQRGDGTLGVQRDPVAIYYISL